MKVKKLRSQFHTSNIASPGWLGISKETIDRRNEFPASIKLFVVEGVNIALHMAVNHVSDKQPLLFRE